MPTDATDPDFEARRNALRIKHAAEDAQAAADLKERAAELRAAAAEQDAEDLRERQADIAAAQRVRDGNPGR